MRPAVSLEDHKMNSAKSFGHSVSSTLTAETSHKNIPMYFVKGLQYGKFLAGRTWL